MRIHTNAYTHTYIYTHSYNSKNLSDPSKWYPGNTKTCRRAESTRLLVTSSHVRSRQPGNSNGRTSFYTFKRVTSKRVDCTRLQVFAFPGNLKNWKLKVCIATTAIRTSNIYLYTKRRRCQHKNLSFASCDLGEVSELKENFLVSLMYLSWRRKYRITGRGGHYYGTNYTVYIQHTLAHKNENGFIAL